MHPMLRHGACAAIQLDVTGPVAVFAPWAIFIFLPMLPVTLFTGEGPEQLRGLAYGLGGAGLLGLYTSILVPTQALRKSAFVRGAVAGLIGLGVVATLLLLFVPEEKHAHYLWRFWRDIPADGRIAVFDRSWYGRVLVERIEGFCREDEWRQAFGEINAFERELTEHGVVVLKFWLHVSHEEQLRRFREREATPHKRHKMNEEDWRNRRQRAAYEVAVGDMLALTHRPAAPWHLVPADNKRFARIDVLSTAARRLEKALDL